MGAGPREPPAEPADGRGHQDDQDHGHRLEDHVLHVVRRSFVDPDPGQEVIEPTAALVHCSHQGIVVGGYKWLMPSCSALQRVSPICALTAQPNR